MEEVDFDFIDFGHPACSFPWCNEVINNKYYINCQAGHAFDEDCFAPYLRHCLGKQITMIFCPLDECESPIVYGDLMHILTPDQKRLIGKINVRQALQKECYVECPCGNINFLDEDCLPLTKGQIVQCSECQKNFCSRCNYQYEQKQEKLSAACDRCTGEMAACRKKIFGALMEAHSTPCPQCNHRWIKNLACTHMRCEQCQTEFCYVCGLSLRQLQEEDETITHLWQHNEDYPWKPKTCPLYLERMRELYSEDTSVRRTRRAAAIEAETRIRRRDREGKETALDIVCPMDPEKALEWFHIQRAIKTLNQVKQELGKQRWELINQIWPELLSETEWAKPLLPWQVVVK